MTFSDRWRARLSAPAVLAAILAAGCGQAEDGPATAPVETYTAMTKGSAAEMMAHLDHLASQFAESEPADPASARKGLLNYTTAVIDTADAALRDKTADPAVREKAAGAIMAYLYRRREADPKALDTLLKAADRIEAENPGGGVAAVVSSERCRVLGVQFQETPVPERPRRIQALADAAIHLSRLDPPPEIAPQLLNKTALNAEVYHRPDLAASLYEALIERFPESDLATFARGAVARIKLKGKVVEGLEGPGIDDEHLSLRDFRGKVVLVEFWGTFCVPCGRETPELEEFRKAMAPRGFLILGVCIDPEKKGAIDILKHAKVEWPQIFSTTTPNNMHSILTDRFGIQGLPFKMVIDREGRLVAYDYYLDELKPIIEKLLAPPKGETAAKPAPADKK